jgi:DNA-binding beta-propeller fold protein YncE
MKRSIACLGALVVGLALTIGGAAAQSAAPLKEADVVGKLLTRTGVYNRPAGATTPNFVVDPSWPAPLPNHWLLGQVGGLYVDNHDHVWVYNRPRTMTNDEAGLLAAAPGAVDAQGRAVNALGQMRVNGFGADCCAAAPSILEFDADGKLLRSWGGPGDPGFLENRCKAADGCIWPNSEHGIYVDSKDNVWIAGNGANVPAQPTGWTTNKAGGDGFILKFDMNGNFKMRIGGTPRAANSNDTSGGVNGTPLVYQPADMVVDPKTNRLYIADGYGNRRILIVDADTGKYIGHFGAYGANPVDDSLSAAMNWQDDYARGTRKPATFRSPVHCVKIANDGKLYVCDRGNNRIQVFDGNNANLGKACTNPDGAVGKCGFLAERFVSEKTYTLPAMPGTAVSVNFSNDARQTCLLVGDNTNQTIYILSRDTLEELGRFGHSGRMAGDFHWLHQVATDSRGNVYTAEVDTGKRIQKFVRYGPTGCSGKGSTTVGGVPR